jgi:hypothetical protein
MNIKLPDFVIADLYKDSLVVDDVATTAKKVPKKIVETPMKPEKNETEKFYLGENKKNILFLVNEKNAVFINDESLATLTKILEALKMNLSDVAIVNFHQHQKIFLSLKEVLNPKFVFLFDIDFLQLQLPFTMPEYQIQQYDHCTFMIAPAITLSSNNDDAVRKEKKKLWENLKKIFGA